MPDEKSKTAIKDTPKDADGTSDLFDLTLMITVSVGNLRSQIDAIYRAQRRLMNHSPDFDNLEGVLNLLEYLEDSIRKSPAANE